METEANVTPLNKVAPEAAEKEFEDLCEAWDIDIERDDFDEDEKKSFNGIKRTIIRKIISGAMVIDGESVKYNLIKPFGQIKELVFTIPQGEALNSLDKYKAHQDQHQMNAYIGSMTKNPPSVVSQIDGRDLKVGRALAQLFLGL